jgi:hypothetical protein
MTPWEATYTGHLTAEHATIADPFDAYKMRAGMPLRKRLLGQLAPQARPEATLFGAQTTRGAIGLAAAGDAPPARAAAVGFEAGLADTVHPNLDTTFQLGMGELPEVSALRPRPQPRPMDVPTETTPWAAGA